VARKPKKAQAVDLHAFHERMVRDARTFPEMYAALEGWSELVVKENPIITCQDGCARCCKHQVLVGEPEWALIHSWMRDNLTKAQRQRIIGRVHAQVEQPGNPLGRWLGMGSKAPRAFVRSVGRGFNTEATRCPMLGDDNRCEIYPVRPFVCRAYGRAQLASGTNMFCEIFLGRLRQQPEAGEDMQLQNMSVMSRKYFELNASRASGGGLFTIMSAHLLRSATGDRDLVKQPIPLQREKEYPVVRQADFPERRVGGTKETTTTVSVVSAP